MVQATLHVRPADDPHPVVHTDNGEDVFVALLEKLGYQYEIEPDTLEIKLSRFGRTAKGVTPDIKLIALPDGRRVQSLYIELTQADRYIDAKQLPMGVRRKNRRHSASRREYITPGEYIERKQRKIRAAMTAHDVDIVLLMAVDQDAILAAPALLAERLQPFIERRAQSQAA